ncbi:MAG: hypothetical protein GY750_07085 [Lentisphaerae bacterium]|nr:hypothetical protein [Lentisphaerota bacterium]MCP4101175.1 hypothetical protein [Lentisphaerota bacterium]
MERDSQIEYCVPELVVGFQGVVIGAACNLPEWKVKPVLQEHRIYMETGQRVSSVTARIDITLPVKMIDIFGRYGGNNEAELPESSGELKIVPLTPGDSNGYIFPQAKIVNASLPKPGAPVGGIFEVCFSLSPDERGRFLIKLPCCGETAKQSIS